MLTYVELNDDGTVSSMVQSARETKPGLIVLEEFDHIGGMGYDVDKKEFYHPRRNAASGKKILDANGKVKEDLTKQRIKPKHKE